MSEKNVKTIVKSDNAPAPIGPYSQAIRVSSAVHTLYVSGQIAIEPHTGNLVSDTLENETHQVMANIEAILNEAGAKFDDVAKCSIFLSDMNNFAAVNEIYSQYFDGQTPPARECIEVARLPKEMNVEISVVAVYG